MSENKSLKDIVKFRMNKINDLKEAGIEVYPYKYNYTHKNSDILDIGCMKGGAGLMMSKGNDKGRVFLIDTFQSFLDKEKLHNSRVFYYPNQRELKNNIKKMKLKILKKLKLVKE